MLRPENQFDFVHVEKFLKLAPSISFSNSFTALHDFETSKPNFGTQFTCLMFTHVLDDYHKSLNHVFDVLRIKKAFDYYFFRKLYVVSLVVLKEQVNHDQILRIASRGGRHNTCVSRTRNWK